MDKRVFERMLREGKIAALDVLQRTASERVDSVTEMLLRHLPYDEVRRALYERTCIAPLADMETLRIAYYKHFDHASVGAYSLQKRFSEPILNI